MSTRLTGYLFLALAMISVGSTVAVSKIIAACMLPFSATALRFAIAFPVFLVMMRVTRTPWPRPNRRDCVILLLQAGAGSVGYTVLLIAGMQFASGADAGVITGMMPVVASMMAFLLLGERPSLSLVCAIILCTLGAFAITLGVDSTGLHFSSHSLLGNALVFAAVVCEGFFILLNKRLDRPIAPLPLSMLMTGIGRDICCRLAGGAHWRDADDGHGLYCRGHLSCGLAWEKRAPADRYRRKGAEERRGMRLRPLQVLRPTLSLTPSAAGRLQTSHNASRKRSARCAHWPSSQIVDAPVRGMPACPLLQPSAQNPARVKRDNTASRPARTRYAFRTRQDLHCFAYPA